tara:strand:+ start:298 stop:672 length:375 start_codon:yes stop_codon:yes gene_type:complete
MNKSLLLLAALACSGVAQAETYVCSTTAEYKVGQSFYTFAREGDAFSFTYTVPAVASGTDTMTRVSNGLGILMDTDAYLILQQVDEEDGDVSVYIVNKQTDTFLQQTVSMSYEYGRAEGSCVTM